MQQIQKPRTKHQLFAHYNIKQVEKAQQRIKENIKLQPAKKSSTQSTTIIKTLRNHFIFYNLSQNELQNIKQRMFKCYVQQGQEIYNEDTQGSCFFIVEKGLLELYQNFKFKKQLKPNDGFGQIALLYLTRRNSTVRAKEYSSLWAIDRISFRQAVQEIIIREYNQNRKCLEGVRFFSQLTYQQKDIVASTISIQKYYKNQTIVQQGDPGSSLYYIKEGVASVFKGDRFIRKLNRGDSFGEQSLYYNTMRLYTIKADDEIICLVLGRDTLNRILGDKIYDVTFKNFIKWAFDRNNILSKLSKNHIEKIIQEMKISSFKAHQSIFRKGISGFQKLVVIVEGSLKKLKNGTIVATKGQCYGQQFLLFDNKNKILDDQIVMNTYGVIAEINSAAFYQAIQSPSLQYVINKNQLKKKKPIEQNQNLLTVLSNKYQLQQFTYIKKIADGQFGQILLIMDPNKHLYVIKCYQKQVLTSYNVQKFIMEQKSIWLSISFPYILKLGRTFQTNNLLFFMIQYISGINFYQVLKEIGLLSSQDCQFYVANIILILEYFQQKNIICRDVKPQNFMVDQYGYLKLISLSTAKISRSQNNHTMKTYTIIGTPHYMAPDIILGKGYNHLVDLWSLGVCFYQFITGVLPFGDSAEEAYEIYKQIMQAQVRFPQFITDKKAKKLIEQLLSHNPQHRHSGSFLNLKSNPFFQNIEWNQFFIRSQQFSLKIPYYPKINQKILNQQMKEANRNLIDIISVMNKKQQVYNPIGDDPWLFFGENIDKLL